MRTGGLIPITRWALLLVLLSIFTSENVISATSVIGVPSESMKIPPPPFHPNPTPPTLLSLNRTCQPEKPLLSVNGGWILQIILEFSCPLFSSLLFSSLYRLFSLVSLCLVSIQSVA